MEFSVKIEGLDALAQSSERVRQAVADEINKAVYASAQRVRTEAIQSIKGGGKTGKVYTEYFRTNRKTGGIFPVKKRDKPHQASAPGEAPATDTGRLDNSITAYASGNGEAITVAGRGTVKYAPMLEFGTSKIAPRPFLFPALEKSKAWITARLQDALRRGLDRGK